MQTLDTERYVLALYRAARAILPPLQAMDSARNQVANELAASFCNWPNEPFLHCVEQWRFADKCFQAIRERAQPPTKSGLFWDIGISTAKPRYWLYTVWLANGGKHEGRCATLTCAAKQVAYWFDGYPASAATFHTGEISPRSYYVSGISTLSAILQNLEAKGAFD